MNNTWITWITVITVITVIFILLSTNLCNQDNFTNIQNQFAISLFNFLQKNPTYIEYLNFLIENKNTSQNLVIKSNYTTLLEQSKNNILTFNNILNMM